MLENAVNNCCCAMAVSIDFVAIDAEGTQAVSMCRLQCGKKHAKVITDINCLYNMLTCISMINATFVEE